MMNYTKRCVLLVLEWRGPFLSSNRKGLLEKWPFTWSWGWLRAIKSSVFFHCFLPIPCMLTFRILSKTRLCCSSFLSSSADNFERCLNQTLFIRESKVKRLSVFDSCAPTFVVHELNNYVNREVQLSPVNFEPNNCHFQTIRLCEVRLQPKKCVKIISC